MEYEDKIRMLTTVARANGMMTALSCMEGATITKRLTLTLEDQLDHMDELLSDLIKEAVKEEVIPDDGEPKTKIGFAEIRLEGTPDQ